MYYDNDIQPYSLLYAGIATTSLTLLDTPEQLSQDVIQEDRGKDLKVLGEHVHHGVEGVVTRRRHPLCLLHKAYRQADMVMYGKGRHT